MWQFICGVIGLVVGFCVSYIFIFPDGLLVMRLGDITFGGVLQVVLGFFIFFLIGGLGIFIGELIDG